MARHGRPIIVRREDEAWFYPTVQDYIDDTGAEPSSVYRALRGERKTYKGDRLEYATKKRRK